MGGDLLSKKIIFLLLLSFIAAAGTGYLSLHTKSPVPPLLYIPEGSKLEIISELAGQESPIGSVNGWFFLFSGKPSPGWVRINGPMSPAELWKSLLYLPREKTRRVIFYSDESIEEFASSFSKQANLPKNEILEYYYRYSPYIEGGIMAGRYDMPYKITAKAAVLYMINRSRKNFKKIFEKVHGRYSDRKFARFLIIASIIQKETWHEKEMPLISSVIYNRLEKEMKLQMDSTLQYGKYSHSKVTPRRIRNDKSRYNTYRYKGLPPEPLCSVTKAAVQAAVKPAKTEYLYFIRNIYGGHSFSSDYTGHLANISRHRFDLARLRKYKKLLDADRRLLNRKKHF